MAALTGRARLAFFAVAAAYAGIAVPLGVRKGDDVATEIPQAQHLLTAQPLYDTPQTQGTWWPPAALLLVLPFAALAGFSLPFAKAAWGLLGIAALAWSVHETGRRWGWRPALLALAIVLFPVHNNFHHLNIETILLALVVATAADLAAARTTRAAVWAGLATALKVFPGLLLLYFAWRREWKALATAAAVAAGATLLALLPLGPGGAIASLARWVSLTVHGQNFQGGTIAALQMQKLGRLGYALGDAPASIVLLHVAAVALVIAVLARRPATDDAPLEVGAVTLLAVLVAPVAWLHTFTLGFPAWVAVFAWPPVLDGQRRQVWRMALVLAAIYASTATSALPAPWRALTPQSDTVGALLALGLLLWSRRSRLRSTPLPPGSPHPA